MKTPRWVQFWRTFWQLMIGYHPVRLSQGRYLTGKEREKLFKKCQNAARQRSSSPPEQSVKVKGFVSGQRNKGAR